MAKTITVSFDHELSPDEVKRRIESGIADARAKYPDALKSANETWAGHRMSFTARAMGQPISGDVEIRPKVVTVTVSLPFMLGLLAGKIRPRIEQEGRKLLE